MFIDDEMKRVLNHRFGGPPLVIESVVHLGLHVGGGAPTLSSGASFSEPPELSGYGRSSIPNDGTSWTPADLAISGPREGRIVKSNLIEISFPVPSVDWGIPTHVGIFEAPTGGAPFAIAIVEAPTLIQAGDLVRFSPGGLTLVLGRAS